MTTSIISINIGPCSTREISDAIAIRTGILELASQMTILRSAYNHLILTRKSQQKHMMAKHPTGIFKKGPNKKELTRVLEPQIRLRLAADSIFAPIAAT